MKFLHTSDWHLGRTLHGVDLHEAQRDFVDQVVHISRRERVAAVVIAGDIFDRAVPPPDAVALFSAALSELSAHTTVIVISGNHDSAVRLGFGAGVHRGGVHIITDIEQLDQPVEVHDGDHLTLFYPIPYLEPDLARHVLSSDDTPLERSHEAVMTAALARVAADRQRRRATGGEQASAVVVAHAFVVGGQASDSERDIQVGGVDSIPAGVFAGLDYVALGHLHGCQQITAGVASGVIRYSGSPLRYSFSEATHTKGVLLVELTASGGCEVDVVPIAQPRGMAVLRGTFDQVTSSEQVALHVGDWVRVVVTDSVRPPELVARIRSLFPHSISIAHEPASPPEVGAISASELATAHPVAVCGQFVEHVTGARPGSDEELVLSRVYDAVKARVNS